MTGSDLMVFAPWIISAVCLAVVCTRLLPARWSAKRPPAVKRRESD